jgi:hypothetical protein
MDYFQTLLQEIETSISIETEKMLEATKKLKDSSDKIEELKRQKAIVMGLNSKISIEY